MNVGRRIADDDDAIAFEIESHHLARTTLREAGQLRTLFVIRTECVHTKAIELESDRAQFKTRALLDVARQQSELGTVIRFERVEQ